MDLTFDSWYRKNKSKHLHLTEQELHKVYEEEATWVFNLKSAVDIKVFTYLLKLANVQGNVHLTPTIRKNLAKLLDISMQQITNSLSTLKKEELIEGERRQYKILL